MRTIERRVNEHTRIWTKILNAGEAHGHHSRIKNSKISESEITANKYYMFKDHKSEQHALRCCGVLVPECK